MAETRDNGYVYDKLLKKKKYILNILLFVDRAIRLVTAVWICNVTYSRKNSVC